MTSVGSNWLFFDSSFWRVVLTALVGKIDGGVLIILQPAMDSIEAYERAAATLSAEHQTGLLSVGPQLLLAQASAVLRFMHALEKLAPIEAAILRIEPHRIRSYLQMMAAIRTLQPEEKTSLSVFFQRANAIIFAGLVVDFLETPADIASVATIAYWVSAARSAPTVFAQTMRAVAKLMATTSAPHAAALWRAAAAHPAGLQAGAEFPPL